MGVLVQAAVTGFREAKHSFDDAKGVLDLGPDLRLGTVLHPLNLVHYAAIAVAAIGKVLRLRRMRFDHVGLPPVAAPNEATRKTGIARISHRWL